MRWRRPPPSLRERSRWPGIRVHFDRNTQAEHHDKIVGTVQLILEQPENQPHRADLSKMLVAPSARRRGVGAALLRAAEELGRTCQKTLLVLDTASADAARLYAKLGWQRCGTIPAYALLPHGGLCDTTFFYRTL